MRTRDCTLTLLLLLCGLSAVLGELPKFYR